MKLPIAMIVVGTMFASSVAEAQEWRAERPFRGLFGSGVVDTEQSLTATASAGSGWGKTNDRNTSRRHFLIGSDETTRFQGGVSTASVGLAYSLNRGAASVGASAGSTGQYYPRLSRRVARREYASLGTSLGLGAGFTAQASASYQPYSLMSMYPVLYEPRADDTVVANEDFPTSLEHYFSYSGGASFSRNITRRTTFSAGYIYWSRTSSVQMEPYHKHGASSRITRAVGRGLNLYAGYGYSEARYGSADRRFTNHQIDVGVNYGRQLSFSRRSTITFSTGTSAQGSAQNESLRYRATGAARLNQELGRTWNASLAYNRGLQFLETWPEPVFSDSASAGVSGLLTRRSQLQFAVRAMSGSVNSNRNADAVSYSGTAGISFAVSRHVSTSLTYAYYRHHFPEGVVLAPGFPSHYEGQTVRASVNVWAPIFQRARRP